MSTPLPAQAIGELFDGRHAFDVWQVVQSVQAGDKQAFAQIYARYRANVAKYIYHRTQDATLTEDLVSATFERALRNISQFRWQGRDFGAWLTTIARNQVADHFKSTRLRLEVNFPEFADLDQADDSAQADPEAVVLDGITAETLRAAVARLRPSQRAVIEQRFYAGLKFCEVGDALGASERGVKALHFRALGALARLIGDGVDERGAPPERMRARARR